MICESVANIFIPNKVELFTLNQFIYENPGIKKRI